MSSALAASALMLPMAFDAAVPMLDFVEFFEDKCSH